MKIPFFHKIFTLGLLMSLLSGCTAGGENIHITEGNMYLNNYNYSLALEQFKQAINDEPTISSAYLKAAEILIAKGKYTDADALLQQGSNIAADKELIWQKLGELSYIKHNYQDALGFYEKTLGLNNNNQDAISGKINCLILTGAEKELGEYVISLADNDISQKNQIIKSVLLLDDPETALNTLTVAAKGNDSGLSKLAEKLNGYVKVLANPDDKLYTLAQIAYEILGKAWYPATLTIADLMIAQNEYYEGGFIYKGSAYIQLSNFTAAEENLVKALTYNPRINDTKILLAQAKFGLKKNSEARDLLNQAKEPLNTLSEEKFTSIFKLLYDNGEFQTGQEYYVAYTNIKAISSPQLILLEFRILFSLNYFAETQSLANQLLAMKEQYTSKEVAEIYAKSGNSLFNIGEKAKALDTLNLANSTDQTLAETQYYFGIIYFDQKDNASAKTSLEKAQDLDFSGDISTKAGELLSNIT